MKKDFLQDLGHLGLTARLKRLSDSISYSIKELYKVNNVDIEPSWHLVFLILKKHKSRTMTEIAEAFHISQAAMVKMLNKMEKAGYIDIRPDDQDKRKKQIRLSEKAKKEFPRFEKIWDAGQNAIRDVLKENYTFMKSLEKVEDKLMEKSFKERAINYLNKEL